MAKKDGAIEVEGRVIEPLPNAMFREVPGTHMSSVTRPELGEEIARFLAA